MSLFPISISPGPDISYFSPRRSPRPIASSSLFALSPSPENKLLHHEPIGAKPRKKRLNIPGKIFDPKWGEEEIELRNDLIDCGIDVCSVDVSRALPSLTKFFPPPINLLQSLNLTSALFISLLP